MGASMASASSQRLRGDTTGSQLLNFLPPYSVGFWFKPVSVAVTGTLFFNGDNTVDDQYEMVQQVNDGLSISAQAGGAAATATISTILVAGEWHYCLARFIGSTNRRISCYVNGNMGYAQSTTSRSPTRGIFALGSKEGATPTNFFNGVIAEYFYAKFDLQPGGGQVDNGIFLDLAFSGPFHGTRSRHYFNEYHSFREHLTSSAETVHDWWNNRGLLSTQSFDMIRILENVNGVTLGEHPPLPGNYRRPTKPQSVMIPI